MKATNKYIEFEVKINSLPLEIFGVFAEGDGDESESGTEDGYKVATADDIDLFAQFLGGGL